MSRPPLRNDLLSLLRGLSRIGSAAVEIRSQEAARAWATSSFRPLVAKGANDLQESITKALQDPSLVQANLSQNASEAVSRISLVAQGIKAFRTQTHPVAPQAIQDVYDPVLDPNVKELSIEDLMMHEAIGNHQSHPTQQTSASEVLDGLGEIADAASVNVGEVKKEISRRLDSFELLLDKSQLKEKEITEEQLYIIHEKVKEMQGAAFGQNIHELDDAKTFESLEKNKEKDMQNQLNNVNEADLKVLSIEGLMMQQALSGLENYVAPDTGVTEALAGLDGIAEEIFSDVKNEVSRRLDGFEPLLDISKIKEGEITQEELQAVSDKVKELQSAAYGHSLQETETVEPSRSIEQVEINNTKIIPKIIINTEMVADVEECIANVENRDKVQDLSIEDMMLQEALSSHGEVVKEAVKKLATSSGGIRDGESSNAREKSEAQRRIAEFDQLIESLKCEEKEITEEHLNEVNAKLKEVQDIAYGHDMKIFNEMKHDRPIGDVLVDALEEHISSSADLGIGIEKTVQGTSEAESGDQDKAKKDLDSENTRTLSEKENANLELDSTIAQVAKSVDVSTSDKVLYDFDVEVPITPNADSVDALSTKKHIGSHPDVPLSKNNLGVPGSSPSSVAFSGAELGFATAAATLTATLSATVATAAVPGTIAVAALSGSAALAAQQKEKEIKSYKENVKEIVEQKVSDTSVKTPEISKSKANTATVSPSFIETSTNAAKPKPKLLGRKPLAKDKPKSTLAEDAKARKVPHSRLGRMLTFGGLAAGLGAGTIAEMTRRTLGVNQGKGTGSLLDASPFLTEANAKRIVDTLCRVRGAALKLGQMLSIQDSALINPQVQKIFERVRQSADFMPAWQLEKAIKEQLGDSWKSRVSFFDDKPFAAASIGQVHLVNLLDGRPAAMKIQYPGVAEGIESDINNLMSTLKVANIIPEGLYIDSVVEVAKRELGWECDYLREAACTEQYRELVKPYPEYYVPEVISDLSTKQIFTSELIEGIPVDKCVDLDQETRNYICEKILRLCLLELFRFGFMQTDPNWSNFFYNADTEQIALLDFGACRAYDKCFVDKYIHIIHGAASKDREKVEKYSRELGFLTGYEAKVMVNAHVDAIMILGEAFQEDKPFLFGSQDTTHRIQHLVPVMLSHRMCAPPEESYSLHRKMSGVFLLCAKLNGMVSCKPLFGEVFNNYKFGGTWEEFQASLDSQGK